MILQGDCFSILCRAALFDDRDEKPIKEPFKHNQADQRYREHRWIVIETWDSIDL